MEEIVNILRPITSSLLSYKIVVILASFCSLLILLSPVNIVLAQEEEDEDDESPITTTNTRTTTETPPPAPSISTNFNFAAAGDWGCTDDTSDTVDNILDKAPEIVLGLGDYSYDDSADCWFDIVQPIDKIMKISIGNHDDWDVEDLEALMNHFGLTEQYYSFDYQNVHFIALGTEEEYLDMSNDKAKQQLAFVQSDLEKASSNPNIDWIIPFFHRIMYSDHGGGLVDEYDHELVDVYHPLFEKYGVHLILQAHTHTYERTYPFRFNSEDSEHPIITSKDSSSNYNNIDGLVIATVGTGGAHPTRLYISDELTPVQYSDIFGFLNVDVSSDGKSLVGTFYDNADGGIKDRFTITKSSETAAATSSSSGTDDSSSDDSDDDSSLFNDSSDDSVFPDSEGNSDGDIYDGDSESSG
jgi:hypothetical protein